MRNVTSSVFGLVNVCFFSFLHRTRVQKWKKNWFCYVHKWENIKMPVSKPIHRSRSTNQICVQRSRNCRNFEKVYYFVFKFLDSQQYSYITNINNWAVAQYDIDAHVGTYRLIFSRFLELRGNLGIVKEKPTRKTCFSREKKRLAPRIYHAIFCLASFFSRRRNFYYIFTRNRC